LTSICHSDTIAFALCGPVAQLGARFNRTEEVEGSNPSRSTGICHLTGKFLTGKISTLLKRLPGPIAQLGARLNGIEKVVGSNPTGSTQMSQLVLGRLGIFKEPAAKSTVDFFSSKKDIRPLQE
jgi:hypothetical protein